MTVPGATSYRVVRSYGGASNTLATLPVSGMPEGQSPRFTDDISFLSGSGTMIQIDEWDGDPLWSRAFQVRVRTVSGAASSPWTYCYMEPSSGVAGSCGTFPANSFPDTGLNGYLVVPAPGVVEVTDVTRAQGPASVDLAWDKSPEWLDERHNRDTTFFKVRRQVADGVVAHVDFAGTWDQVTAYTTALSGSSGVTRGDWSHFEVARCNSINPYEWGGLGVDYSGVGHTQCGPWSRPWSALGLPDVPTVDATVNGTANTNTARFGKNAATTTPDYTAQRVNHYDVAETQGGGTGTSAASGSTTTVQDSVLASAKTAPWGDDVAATSYTHPRREGDFTRYAVRACNVTAGTTSTGSWMAGVTGEAGQGVGTESCSDWSGDTQRYWQPLAPPTCTATATWNSLVATGRFGHLYVSPIDTLTTRGITRVNTTTGTSWSKVWPGAGMSDVGYTWTDDGWSADAAEGTVKPLTGYSIHANVASSYAGSTVASGCATGTIPSPPIPDRPVVSITLDSVSATFGTPNVRVAWDADDAPVVSNWVQRSYNGAGWSGTTNAGSFTQGATWKVPVTLSVRAAHTSRLGGWGFYSSNSTTFSPNPTVMGGDGCPYMAFGPSESQWLTWSSAGWSGSNCVKTYVTTSRWSTEQDTWFRQQVLYECGDIDAPSYCNDIYSRNREISQRIASSPYTRAGETITFRFTFGSSVLNRDGVPGYALVVGAFNPPPGNSVPSGSMLTVRRASYEACGTVVSCGG